MVKVDEARVVGSTGATATGKGSRTPLQSTCQSVGAATGEPTSNPIPILAGATVRFIVPMAPVGKPTMTRRDQWLVGEQARPCVRAYRDWCDRIRADADQVAWPPVLHGRILVVSYLPIPQLDAAVFADTQWEPRDVWSLGSEG